MVNKFFSSVKTAIFFLVSLGIILTLGTFFFQLDAHKKNTIELLFPGNDNLMSVVKMLDVTVFTLFIIFVILLLTNLIMCSLTRLKTLRRSGVKQMSLEEIKNSQGIFSIKGINVESVLKKEGFTLKESIGNSTTKIYEKGISLSWTSLGLHACVIIFILTLLLSGFFTKEILHILYEGTPDVVTLENEKTKFEDFLNKIGFNRFNKIDTKYTMRLEEIVKESYKVPLISLPDNYIDRFLFGTGLKKINRSTDGFSYIKKNWSGRLEIENNRTKEISDIKIQTNDPYKIDDIYIYIIEPLMSLKFSINNEIYNVSSNTNFKVKNMEGQFYVRYSRNDIVYRADNIKIEDNRMNPAVTVNYIPPSLPEKKKEIGSIRVGEAITFNGMSIKLIDYKMGCLFLLKKDPAFLFISIACGLFVIGLIIISCASWYRVQLASGQNQTYLLINAKGIWADKETLLKNISGLNPYKGKDINL